MTVKKPKDKIIILSLGGSIIVPDDVDTAFLKRFRDYINQRTKQGYRFVIMCGGGKTCRNYISAAKKLISHNKTQKDAMDWIGIKSTLLNAELVKTIFGKSAFDDVIHTPSSRIKKIRQNVVVAGGWKPGFSSDYDAVLYAKLFGSDTVINLTNVDYVYTKDPEKFKDAAPIKKMSWQDYLRMIGTEFKAGGNYPFDPLASKLALRHKITVYTVNGRSLAQLDKILEDKNKSGKSIKGTMLYPHD